MKKLRKIFFTTITTLSFVGFANAASYVNGNQYRSASDALRLAYVMGITDAITLLHQEGQVSMETGFVASCIEDMQSGQIRAIVDNYLEKRPEKWHLGMGSQVFSALALSCTKSPP